MRQSISKKRKRTSTTRRGATVKRFLQGLDRVLSPILILSYVALSLLLLAAVPQGRAGLLLAILWGAVTAAALRWSVWGILKSAKTRTTPRAWTVLVRTTEALFLLLTVAALVASILLREIPAVWLFFPTPLFGLQGALRLDAQ